MEALSHNDIEDFLAVAGDFLDADPVHNSVHLTSADAAVQGRRTPTALISVHDNGSVVGAVTQMEGRPLHVAAMPPAAAPLVVDVLRGREITEVTGTRDRVEAFRTLWRDGGQEVYALRLYRLEDLTVPDVPGESRLAIPADDALITDWWTAFVAELDGLPHDEAAKRAADSRWMPAGHVVWQVDGVPVSWAASTSPIGGVSRVGPVYTPPEHRRHGYAAAATAAVSQWAYGEGVDHVVLTADLANSTANSVYQGIGFRAVSDWTEYRWA